MVPRQWTDPWVDVSMDLVGPLPRTKQGNRFILVIVDKSTRWVEAFPLKRATGIRITSTFLKNIVCRFGAPKILHTDNGTQFKGNPLKETCTQLGITQRFTPIYHAQSNPTERSNKDLMVKIAMFAESHQQWDEHIDKLLFATRTADSETTKHSPAFLLYGFHPRHPVSNWMEIVSSKPLEQRHLGQKLALLEAAEESVINSQKQKNVYNARHSDVQFEPKEEILIRTHPLSKAAEGFSSKLHPKWEGPYLIIKKISPVSYVIKTKRHKAIICHTKDLKKYHIPPLGEAPVQTTLLTPPPGKPENSRPQRTKRLPARLLGTTAEDGSTSDSRPPGHPGKSATSPSGSQETRQHQGDTNSSGENYPAFLLSQNEHENGPRGPPRGMHTGSQNGRTDDRAVRSSATSTNDSTSSTSRDGISSANSSDEETSADRDHHPRIATTTHSPRALDTGPARTMVVASDLLPCHAFSYQDSATGSDHRQTSYPTSTTTLWTTPRYLEVPRTQQEFSPRPTSSPPSRIEAPQVHRGVHPSGLDFKRSTSHLEFKGGGVL